jgi:hypothetical protein
MRGVGGNAKDTVGLDPVPGLALSTRARTSTAARQDRGALHGGSQQSAQLGGGTCEQACILHGFARSPHRPPPPHHSRLCSRTLPRSTAHVYVRNAWPSPSTQIGQPASSCSYSHFS